MRSPLLLALAVLLAGCTGGPSGSTTDTDGDGLRDSQETTPHDITVVTANGTETRSVTSDPALADTDGDGVSDIDEYARHTDPRSVDTDGDGLLDGHDLAFDAHSSRAAEMRARGILERPPGVFWGELDRCDGLELDATSWSSDRPVPDKLGDAEELRAWTITVRGRGRVVASDPCVPDTDRDGLADDAEKAAGTDPRANDTDGDGVLDGIDADPLWDLGLRLGNASASPGIRLTLSLGRATATADLRNASHLDIDVPDASPTPGHLTVSLILSASDADSGAPLKVFPDGGSIVITLDAAAPPTEHQDYRGADGAVSFDWAATRT